MPSDTRRRAGAEQRQAAGYEIRLPGPGTYSLDVETHRRQARPASAVHGRRGRDAPAGHHARAAAGRPELRAITGRTSCVRNPQTNARTAALWEDARAALTAVRDHAGPNDRHRFRRSVRAQARRQYVAGAVRDSPQSVGVDGSSVPKPAGGSVVGRRLRDGEPGRLDRLLRARRGRAAVGHVPHRPLLQDRAREVGEHFGQIGLAFQPIPERKKPDIKGVLWMDEKSAELQTLEFSYSWLPNDVRPVDFGGVVSFFRLPGGRWIVRSWRIRMPEFGHQRIRPGRSTARPAAGRLSVVRISEEGGAVPLRRC